MMGAERTRAETPRGWQWLVAVISLGCAVALYLWWQAVHRGLATYATAIYPFDDADEWRYTACSRLVEHGYALFTQVFSAQPPLLFLSLAAGMRLFGDSIAGARTVEIGFGLLSLVCTWGLCWRIAGPLASAIAALLLAVSPGFLIYSRAVEAEGPMMALVTLSLALAAFARHRGSAVLPVLAGLSAAAAILMKLFAVEAIAPALWLLCAFRPSVVALRAGLVFLAAAALPVVLDFGVFAPAAQWSQVVTLHDQASRLPFTGGGTPQVVLHFLGLDPGMAILAVLGLAMLGFARCWLQAGLALLWLGGTLVMLLLFRPLFPHHPAILLTSLAVTAGCGAGVLQQVRWRPALRGAGFAIAAVLYLIFVPHLAHLDRHSLLPGYNPLTTDIAAAVDRWTTPAQFIATDDLAVADLGHRLVPPPLCDPSNVRLRSGYLTAATLIAATRQYRAALVAPTFGIFLQVPGYLHWVGTHYPVARRVDGKAIYLDRPPGNSR